MSLKDFFKPSLDHTDPKIRVRAVERLDDQTKLREIAQRDKDALVRKRAVQKLNDQGLLIEFDRKDESPDVRIAALRGVRNPAILEEIIKADESAKVRIEALEILGRSYWCEMSKELDRIMINGKVQRDFDKAPLRYMRLFVRVLRTDPDKKVRSTAAKLIPVKSSVLEQIAEPESSAFGRTTDRRQLEFPLDEN